LPRSNKIIHDEEFGDIEIRRVRGAYVRIKIQPNGKMIAHLPYFVPYREVTKLLDHSRDNLRKTSSKILPQKTYAHGDLIGKSHRLIIEHGADVTVTVKNQQIIVSTNDMISASEKTRAIKDGVAKALRKEAKSYLPRRLEFLAQEHGFSYEQIRFTHAKSRWGSCSSRGTISLNITLMTLPDELIDYVLLHELNHTKHMNHSARFWSDLEKICPNAKIHRKKLHGFSPYL